MMISRVNSELEKKIADVIRGGLHDPRINGIITVRKVETSSDLAYAKVFVSILTDGEKKKTECFNAICQAAGYIRKTVMPMMKIRNMPTLEFKLDNGYEYESHINDILKTLDIKPESDDDNE